MVKNITPNIWVSFPKNNFPNAKTFSNFTIRTYPFSVSHPHFSYQKNDAIKPTQTKNPHPR